MTDISMPVARADARTRTGEQTRTPPVWEPLVTLPWNAEPLAQLRAVTRLLDELLGDWPGTPAVMADGVSTPLGDLEELDDAWLLRVELPGVKQDDVDIQLTGRRLVVRAERKETERKACCAAAPAPRGGTSWRRCYPARSTPTAWRLPWSRACSPSGCPSRQRSGANPAGSPSASPAPTGRLVND
jgi:Hsp20/alpha crystallin family protein